MKFGIELDTGINISDGLDAVRIYNEQKKFLNPQTATVGRRVEVCKNYFLIVKEDMDSGVFSVSKIAKVEGE